MSQGELPARAGRIGLSWAVFLPYCHIVHKRTNLRWPGKPHGGISHLRSGPRLVGLAALLRCGEAPQAYHRRGL